MGNRSGKVALKTGYKLRAHLYALGARARRPGNLSPSTGRQSPTNRRRRWVYLCIWGHGSLLAHGVQAVKGFEAFALCPAEPLPRALSQWRSFEERPAEENFPPSAFDGGNTLR